MVDRVALLLASAGQEIRRSAVTANLAVSKAETRRARDRRERSSLACPLIVEKTVIDYTPGSLPQRDAAWIGEGSWALLLDINCSMIKSQVLHRQHCRRDFAAFDAG